MFAPLEVSCIALLSLTLIVLHRSGCFGGVSGHFRDCPKPSQDTVKFHVYNITLSCLCFMILTDRNQCVQNIFNQKIWTTPIIFNILLNYFIKRIFAIFFVCHCGMQKDSSMLQRRSIFASWISVTLLMIVRPMLAPTSTTIVSNAILIVIKKC